MGLPELFRQGDAVTQAVAILLLAMSVSSWVVILWKAWLLRRASADVNRHPWTRRGRRSPLSTARPWCCR